MIAFKHHRRYADLHLLVEGHEFSSYGSRILDEAIPFDEASDIGFVHCENSIHFIWVIIILQSSSLGNLTNQMVIQVRKKQSENIYSKLRLIRCLK